MDHDSRFLTEYPSSGVDGRRGTGTGQSEVPK